VWLILIRLLDTGSGRMPSNENLHRLTRILCALDFAFKTQQKTSKNLRFSMMCVQCVVNLLVFPSYQDTSIEMYRVLCPLCFAEHVRRLSTRVR
jgi:hypothetical protein